jgi:hypothetical protein
MLRINSFSQRGRCWTGAAAQRPTSIFWPHHTQQLLKGPESSLQEEIIVIMPDVKIRKERLRPWRNSSLIRYGNMLSLDGSTRVLFLLAVDGINESLVFSCAIISHRDSIVRTMV